MENKPFPLGDLEDWQLPSYCHKGKEADQWGCPAKHPPLTAHTHPHGFYFWVEGLSLFASHLPSEACLSKHPTGTLSKLLSIIRIKITLSMWKILVREAKKQKLSFLFQRTGEEMQLLDLCWKGKDSQKKVTGPRFPQLEDERSCCGAISVFSILKRI